MSKYYLGIELGSTRIKSVLIDADTKVVAQGSHEWENSLVGGLWSYSLSEVESGLQTSYRNMACDFEERLGAPLTEIEAIGISAMMHGYLAFDKDDRLLVPFRTWRNTNTEVAADELSEAFGFNVPMRWSVSHYYQAVLNGEEHVSRVAFLTTLAGYVHYRLTGKKVLGVGDASGMFPTDGTSYDGAMLEKLDKKLQKRGMDVSFESLLPKILTAGDAAGTLTEAGASYLDPTGQLKSGALLCPPEGDVGTGMVATNAVRQRSANVSAGTSAFLMVALEKPLDSYYKEIDVVASPVGDPVAMVHVNNFTTEITAWANLFEELVALAGGNIARGKLFDLLYSKALDGDADCGSLMGYNFLAGEPVVGVKDGTVLMARSPEGTLTLANLMKMQLYSALGALAIGCEMLKKENVAIDSVCGHGGFFKAPLVGQRLMSAAIGAPVTIMKNAGEGGAWGIAVLALYAAVKDKSLADFLDTVFAEAEKNTASATDADLLDFGAFMKKFKSGIAVQKLAAEVL